ncbi:MAG: 50S ribosomal protein L24 [Acidimicrobiia bacterium]
MARSVAGTRVPEIRKGDTVVVLSGKDAGKRGVVERVYRTPRSSSRGYVAGAAQRAERGAYLIVQGLNIAKRHTKPRPMSSQSDRVPQMQQGGILEIPQPLALGKVMVVCPRCDQPTRVAHATLENGVTVRVCRHCGEQLEVKAG